VVPKADVLVAAEPLEREGTYLLLQIKCLDSGIEGGRVFGCSYVG